MVASEAHPIGLSTFGKNTLSFTPDPPSYSELNNNNETDGDIEVEHRGNTELLKS